METSNTIIATTSDQQNIINFITSKRKKMLAKKIIKDSILFGRTLNTCNLINTALSGKERGSSLEFEYHYYGIEIACTLIGLSDDPMNKVIEMFNHFMSKDFFTNPTERKSYEQDAEQFYKEFKGFLKELVTNAEHQT